MRRREKRKSRNIIRIPGVDDKDTIWIRGIPMVRDQLLYLETLLKADLVTSPQEVAGLDKISDRHVKEFGKAPKIITDPLTHDAYFRLTGLIDPQHYRITVTAYFKLRYKYGAQLWKSRKEKV